MGGRSPPGFPENDERIGLDPGVRDTLDLQPEGVFAAGQVRIGDVFEHPELPVGVEALQFPGESGLKVVEVHQRADEDERVFRELEPVRHVRPEGHRDVVDEDLLDAVAE